MALSTDNTAAASSANNSANTSKKNIVDYKEDTVDIYGKLYYLSDILTKNDLRQMNRQLKNAEYVLEPKFPIIYTLHDFISEYIHNTNAKTHAYVIEDMIELCKKYLQLGKTYIKDCIKDGKNIKVDNETEKELLSYILTTRYTQMESERTNTLVSIHGRSYFQLHNSIIAKIQVDPNMKPIDNESNIMDFLLFYVWNILQKQPKTPVNAKTEWNKASPKKTWHEMILEIRQKKIEDVINAFVEIKQTNEEGLINTYKNTKIITKENIKKYLSNLLTIIEGYKASAETEGTVEGTAEGTVEGTVEEAAKRDKKIAILAAEAFTNYLKDAALKEAVALKDAALKKYDDLKDKIDPNNLMGGGSLLPPPFFIQALQPIMHYLHTNHSIYSFITDIVPSYNIIGDMQQLHHICSSITNEKQYGFYRIKHIPSELFTHIQQLIDCSTAYTSYNGTHYSASHCNTDGDYLYFLCLDGNIAFTENVTEKKQIKEQTAVRTFFQEKTLYLLYSPKKEVRMSNYMRDPYYVYDINYDDINHDTHQIRIRNIDTLLNKQDVPLGNYLTVESKKLVDICQLELSLIHQLNHLIVV